MKINFSRFSIAQLREFLISKDFDEDDVKNSRKIDLIETIEDNNYQDELNKLYPQEIIDDDDDDEDEETKENLVDFENSEIVEEQRTVIAMTDKNVGPIKGSKEWNDYVLSQFTEDEFVDFPIGDGKQIKTVKCDGLRRVAELLLGEIVCSKAENIGVNYPDYTINKPSDLAKLNNPPFAWVQYTVTFRNSFGDPITWGGCADVNANNTDPKFLPFALTSAETKAEGRALRKALGLKIYATEELTNRDTVASVSAITNADWSKGEITDQQKGLIKRLCEKMNIDVYKLINCQRVDKLISYDSKKIRNSSIDDLTNEQGIRVIQMLNDLQQNKLEKDSTIFVD